MSREFIEGGYIKTFRKMLTSNIFGNPDLFRLWMYLLLSASYQEYSITPEGCRKPLMIHKGQLVTSRNSLHRVLYPSGGLNTPTPQTVWNWLQILVQEEMISIQSTTKFSVITILNYGIYQEN